MGRFDQKWQKYGLTLPGKRRNVEIFLDGQDNDLELPIPVRSVRAISIRCILGSRSEWVQSLDSCYLLYTSKGFGARPAWNCFQTLSV